MNLVDLSPECATAIREAGFGQLLVPLTGSGWVAGADGVQFSVIPGQAAYWSRGELHSKGSEDGMTAVMIQVRDLGVEPQPAAPQVPKELP